MLAYITINAKLMTAVLVLALTPNTALADDAALFSKTLKATCWVQTPNGGHGTGWVVDHEQRLVITNKHVVGTFDEASVMFPMFKDGSLVTAAGEYLRQADKLTVSGKVLARDDKRDLALIQLDKLPEGVTALALADASVKLEDAVLSIGNSGLAGGPIEQGTLWKMRSGKIAIKSFRTLYYMNVNQNLETSMLNTDLGTRPGDSGGPVVNERGELIGVTSGGNGKDSFAVDVTEVRMFLANVFLAKRRPASTCPVLTGTYTMTWNSENGKRLFAGITLRQDGTVLYEDEMGAEEGVYSLTNDRLILSLPHLRFEIESTMTWAGSDTFRVLRNTTEYTMARR